MDNICIFTNLVIKGEVKISTLPSGIKKAVFGASAPRPNTKGVWNKNFFTAFDAVAESMEKQKVTNNTVVVINAEQQCYMDAEKVMRHNYKVVDFQVIPGKKEKEEASSPTPSQTPKPQQTPQQPPKNGNVQGYEGMMSFMTS